MYSTLIVRTVNVCDGLCSRCPHRASSASMERISLRTIELLIDSLKGFVFREALLLCPNPLMHREILSIADMLKNCCEKLYMFVPINSVERLTKAIAERIDEIVLVMSMDIDLKLFEGYVEKLVSQGVENVVLYMAIDRDVDLSKLRHNLAIAKRFAMRVRIGGYPYLVPMIDTRAILVERGVDVGLVYGYLYGLKASRAFLEDYPITVLSKPDPDCRKLYIDYNGKVGKCPLLGTVYTISNDPLPLEKLRELIYSKCSYETRYPELVPRIEISIALPDGKVIPSDILRILELIDQLRSFRRACTSLGISVSTCVEKIRRIEREVGIKLVKTRRGGKSRGLTVLTDEAKRIVDTYRELKESIAEVLNRKALTRFYVD